ncbi:hypothetical protein H696_04265 [Fonticula alba]|uniref:Uncharacterized protein n=1 Tax=Fonticula alba TaxID=691883 RepID=A0A058Z5P8_FONAL|nr:hypothetical protein H696_04265 [Fonticula alba]KCV68847.1 hypothetical protein H696_04265 [Fonticula alba]|eukprot:XP_009496418.1 hypothetical protein H696_04265 [Fonticula alba]
MSLRHFLGLEPDDPEPGARPAVTVVSSANFFSDSDQALTDEEEAGDEAHHSGGPQGDDPATTEADAQALAHTRALLAQLFAGQVVGPGGPGRESAFVAGLALAALLPRGFLSSPAPSGQAAKPSGLLDYPGQGGAPAQGFWTVARLNAEVGGIARRRAGQSDAATRIRFGEGALSEAALRFPDGPVPRPGVTLSPDSHHHSGETFRNRMLANVLLFLKRHLATCPADQAVWLCDVLACALRGAVTAELWADALAAVDAWGRPTVGPDPSPGPSTGPEAEEAAWQLALDERLLREGDALALLLDMMQAVLERVRSGPADPAYWTPVLVRLMAACAPFLARPLGLAEGLIPPSVLAIGDFPWAGRVPGWKRTALAEALAGAAHGLPPVDMAAEGGPGQSATLEAVAAVGLLRGACMRAATLARSLAGPQRSDLVQLDPLLVAGILWATHTVRRGEAAGSGELPPGTGVIGPGAAHALAIDTGRLALLLLEDHTPMVQLTGAAVLLGLFGPREYFHPAAPDAGLSHRLYDRLEPVWHGVRLERAGRLAALEDSGLGALLQARLCQALTNFSDAGGVGPGGLAERLVLLAAIRSVGAGNLPVRSVGVSLAPGADEAGIGDLAPEELAMRLDPAALAAAVHHASSPPVVAAVEPVLLAFSTLLRQAAHEPRLPRRLVYIQIISRFMTVVGPFKCMTDIELLVTIMSEYFPTMSVRSGEEDGLYVGASAATGHGALGRAVLEEFVPQFLRSCWPRLGGVPIRQPVLTDAAVAASPVGQVYTALGGGGPLMRPLRSKGSERLTAALIEYYCRAFLCEFDDSPEWRRQVAISYQRDVRPLLHPDIVQAHEREIVRLESDLALLFYGLDE